jgi:hypothetical protein
MIVVAVVACALGGVISAEEYSRVYSRQRQASDCADAERFWLERARAAEAGNSAVPKKEARYAYDLARYCAALKGIYLRAAAHPWRAVPPIPPIAASRFFEPSREPLAK